eukprot:SM001758S03108  [mRNA]  locus=s1758:1102:1966:- [translate_table: standard]
MGMPLGRSPLPSQPLPENAELTWDDGTPNPEPCLDHVAPMVGSYEGLAYLGAGLGFFVLLGYAAAYNDKASRVPWTPKRFPQDNGSVEEEGETA